MTQQFDQDMLSALSPLEDDGGELSPVVLDGGDSSGEVEAGQAAGEVAAGGDDEDEEEEEDYAEALDIVSALMTTALLDSRITLRDVAEAFTTADVEDPRLLIACMLMSDARPFSAARLVELIERAFPEEAALGREVALSESGDSASGDESAGDDGEPEDELDEDPSAEAAGEAPDDGDGDDEQVGGSHE